MNIPDTCIFMRQEVCCTTVNGNVRKQNSFGIIDMIEQMLSKNRLMCILQAKRIIALIGKNWMSQEKWATEITSNMSMEKITYIVKKKQNVFETVWKHLLT